MTKEYWFDVGEVKRVEPVSEQEWVSGYGKDAVYNVKKVGTKVVVDNGGAFVFPLKTTPDCKVGDRILVQFERRPK